MHLRQAVVRPQSRFANSVCRGYGGKEGVSTRQIQLTKATVEKNKGAQIGQCNSEEEAGSHKGADLELARIGDTRVPPPPGGRIYAARTPHMVRLLSTACGHGRGHYAPRLLHQDGDRKAMPQGSCFRPERALPRLH